MNNASIKSITALVLAGGRGSRMGGVDKGLQLLDGQALAWHSLQRLKQQVGVSFDTLAINANRHLDTYRTWGLPVWSDTVAEQPGPLAGFLSGCRNSPNPWLLTVPCDAPDFPLDLAQRLAAALSARPDADIAVACAPDDSGVLRRQPVFALMRVSLAEDLEAFVHDNGRKVGQWLARHQTVEVAFKESGDDPMAFHNINTPEALQASGASR